MKEQVGDADVGNRSITTSTSLDVAKHQIRTYKEKQECSERMTVAFLSKPHAPNLPVEGTLIQGLGAQTTNIDSCQH